MILKRFYDENLAQASYLVGCEKTKQAAIVDPSLDTSLYVEAAARLKLSIAHVAETHIHADFLSGAASLAAETGGELWLSGEGGARWGYDFQSADSARELRDGDEIRMGQVTLQALHTPGHTPEHLTFVVSDASRGEASVGALTGDFIFVGDVGRPDLLERAVGAEGTMRESAATLFRSLRKFLSSQPDHLQIWPGHGAGSACGKSLGTMPSSTVGYEKLFNWALAPMDENEFVAKVLKDQPVPPRYFAEMKKRNRLAEILPPTAFPAALPPAAIAAALQGGATVLDTRPAKTFAGGHIPGTINIPFNNSFLTWAGALLEPERDVVLITAGEPESKSIASQLRKIGLTRIRGWLAADAMEEHKGTGATLSAVPQISVRDLHDSRRDGSPKIIDVRAPYEWAEGHIPGAIHIPLAELPSRAAELAAAGGSVAVHCKGGGRSSIAASVLRASGVPSVSNITEGFDGWKAAGFPVAREGSNQ